MQERNESVIIPNGHSNPRQLRVLFAGRDNMFNRGIMNWLNTRYELIAIYLLEMNQVTDISSIWGKLKKGDIKGLQPTYRRIYNRIRRYSLPKVIDEMAFQFLSQVILTDNEQTKWRSDLPQEFWDSSYPTNVPVSVIDNVHDGRVIEHTKSLRPDIVFSVCGATIFRKKFYTIPR